MGEGLARYLKWKNKAGVQESVCSELYHYMLCFYEAKEINNIINFLCTHIQSWQFGQWFQEIEAAFEDLFIFYVAKGLGNKHFYTSSLIFS